MQETDRNQPMIVIENLTKNYGAKRVLDAINLTVNRGEVMGFLGPNGAGKSTTMNILTGYLAASSGTVLIHGVNAMEQPSEAKRHVGYLPEIPPLYTDMTVREYLRFVYELKGVQGNKEIHLAKIMEQVRIQDVQKRMIRNLSKGYRQRVGLAQALIGDPEILILDEPTVGLDPKQIMEIRDVIAELGKKRTVIISTHILQEVLAVCDCYTIIHQGNIVASGKMDEFAGRTSGKYRLRVKGTWEETERIVKKMIKVAEITSLGSFESETVDVVLTAIDGEDIREEIFQGFSDAGFPVLMFAPMTQSLEEVFMQAISKDSVQNVEEAE